MRVRNIKMVSIFIIGLFIGAAVVPNIRSDIIGKNFFSESWTDNPAENTVITNMSNEQVLPKIVVDSDGFAYISWFSVESGNYNVRLQRLDPNGASQWEENGKLISSELQDSWITDYDMAISPDGFAVITFQDIRTGQNNPVAYRISPDGVLMWGPTGILLADDTNFDPSPKTCVTTLGNAVFAWQSMPDVGESEVRLQKISPDGDLLWGDGIILSQSGVDFAAPYLLPAEGDYVYLIWHKETGTFPYPDRGLYVQKLDVDGSFMWGTDVEIYAPVASGPVVSLEMCRDDTGGIIFTWYNSDIYTHFDSYVQRMDSTGTITMPANGVIASTSTIRNHMYPAPAFLNQTQEIVLFFSEQDSDQITRGLYAQKFDMVGNRLWGNEGKGLIELSYNDYGHLMADGFGNQAVCIYQAAEFGTTMDAKIQAVMLDSTGNFVWDEQFIDLSTYQSSKLHNVMTGYYMGQWVAVWEDERNDGGDIYAQNIQLDGTLGVVTNSVIADFTYEPTNPLAGQMVYFNSTSTDTDGYIINWTWEMGDSFIKYGEQVTHSYLLNGTYQVNLTVMNNNLTTDTISKTVYVGEVEILDVEQTVQDRGFPIRHALDGDWAAAQNFTPTLNSVTKVELYLRTFGTPEFDLVVELRTDDPQGALLDTKTFTPGEVPSVWTWFEVDFEDQFVGIGSDVYVVIPPAPSGVTTSFGYEWGYAFGNQYDDGSFWFTRDGGGLWRDLPTMYEFVFRTYGYS